MRQIRYLQLDVFADAPFSGNQLAVFLDASNVTPDEMQAMAREMNFSESVFVLPPADPRSVARLRIFTPQVELPFAGHPVIGATFGLAAAGRITPSDPSPITLEVGVGPLNIELMFADARLSFAWMRQPIPTFQPWTGDRAALAASLNLSESDLRHDPPIERGSAGMPFVYVPVVSVAALDKAEPGPAFGAALDVPDQQKCAYLFALPAAAEMTGATGEQVSARMLASGIGIAEDPATGSAAGPLGAYLARHGLTPLDDGRARVTIAQGVRMGRPSRLVVTVEEHEGAIREVRVGGEAVVVAQGEFLLPDVPATGVA